MFLLLVFSPSEPLTRPLPRALPIPPFEARIWLHGAQHPFMKNFLRYLKT